MSTTTIPAGLADLAALPNWVNHDAAKVPYIPSLAGEPEYAKAAVPGTWRSSDLALAAFAAGRFAGIGFQIHAGQGIWGGDLDHCRDAATGRMTPRASAIIMLANSYAEPSPSGTGAHFFVKGPLPTRMVADGRLGRKQGGHELYGGAHYLTMTLKPFPGRDALRTIDQLTADLIYGLMFPDDLAPAVASQQRPAPQPAHLDDADLLAKACASEGGEDFRRRHEGVLILGNASDDDWGYFGTLRFWAQADPARMRRMALASGRVRDKWFTKRGAVDWLDYNIARILEEDRAKPVYDPGQHSGSRVPDAADAGDADLLATLHAAIARLGDALRREQEEGARLVARVTELETEVAALEAVIGHADQAAGVGALDFVEGGQRAYRRGEVLTLGGRDFARDPIATAATRRAPKTISRGAKALLGLAPTDPWPREPVACGPGGAFAIFARPELIETPTFRGTVEVPYLHIPPEWREQRGKAVLGILPTCTKEKKHGGRRTIPVPPEVAAQPHPVRREREHVTRWYDALTDQKIAAQTEHLGTDHWTNQGEQRTLEEIAEQRVARGYEPPRTPTYRPPQPPLRVVRPEPRHLADYYIEVPCRQDAEVSPPPSQPVDVPGQCADPDCGHPAAIGGYCAAHWEEQRRRYAGAWDYAAGAN